MRAHALYIRPSFHSPPLEGLGTRLPTTPQEPITGHGVILHLKSFYLQSAIIVSQFMIAPTYTYMYNHWDGKLIITTYTVV